MNVTVKDIKAIKPGQTKPFLCDSENACKNASTLISIVQRTARPEGVSRYSRKIDYDQKIINITAHPY
jgi:hypothetical protein